MGNGDNVWNLYSLQLKGSSIASIAESLGRDSGKIDKCCVDVRYASTFDRFSELEKLGVADEYPNAFVVGVYDEIEDRVFPRWAILAPKHIGYQVKSDIEVMVYGIDGIVSKAAHERNLSEINSDLAAANVPQRALRLNRY